MDGDQIIDAIEPHARARTRKDLLVYVHVPFCSSKCHFCDFVVKHKTSDLIAKDDLQTSYTNALCQQIRWYGPRLEQLGYRATNVYWGGGTPTRLSSGNLARISQALVESFDTSNVREYTLECSPETLTAEKLNVLLDAGLNRISIGVQSFDPGILRQMGRSHSADDALKAIELVRSRLENFNIDLVVAYTDQTLAASRASIERAVALQIPHVTVYLFRLTNPSLVSVQQVNKKFRSVDGAQSAFECLSVTGRILEDAGFTEYMHAYFAREDRFRFDSEDYYFSRRADFIGFGAGAQSFLGRHAMLQTRRGREVDLLEYGRNPTAMDMVVPASALFASSAYTAVLDALGSSTGIRYELWADQFGVDRASLPRALRDIPDVTRALSELEAAGATILEDAEGIRLDPGTFSAAFNRYESLRRESE